ncbi:MAG: AraC family transcriptional regulator [Spirochaetaceae bacterium]
MIFSTELLNCGEEKCVSGHEFGGKREYFLLHIILEGKGEYFSEGRSWSLDKGDAFLIFPQQMHLYRADFKEPWKYFWFGFNGEFNKLFNPLQIDQKHPVIRANNTLNLYDQFKGIDMTRIFQHPADILKNLGILNMILGELCRGKVSKNYHSTKTEPGISHHVDSMRGFIDKNFDTPIKVQDVIDFVYLERSYASRIFKDELGFSLGSYIREHRMNRAIEYIKEGWSGKQTAYSCGYNDYHNFLKAFKKYTGKTPKTYRMN